MDTDAFVLGEPRTMLEKLRMDWPTESLCVVEVMLDEGGRDGIGCRGWGVRPRTKWLSKRILQIKVVCRQICQCLLEDFVVELLMTI